MLLRVGAVVNLHRSLQQLISVSTLEFLEKDVETWYLGSPDLRLSKLKIGSGNFALLRRYAMPRIGSTQSESEPHYCTQGSAVQSLSTGEARTGLYSADNAAVGAAGHLADLLSGAVDLMWYHRGIVPCNLPKLAVCLCLAP